MRRLILGTAGHIDHGKTALVRALTGVNTDRLPEEARRGVTIDLGFACLDLPTCRLGIVDAPGHHRFVRNMLAGATGYDLALLVVAADDGVMPQTREHLEILQHLRLSAGVIAITKSDRASSDWIELVEADVREVVGEGFLAEAPIVRTSVVDNTGIDALKSALSAAAESASSNRIDRGARFRMAIDRSFAVEGYGTVVTGHVAAGHAAVGDTLDVVPGERKVQVRGLQSHDQAVVQIEPGMRAALNLTGIHFSEVRRGDWLAAPDSLTASGLTTVEILVSQTAARPLKNRTQVRLHVGATDVVAKVTLLGAAEIAPGASGHAQLRLAEPCPLVHSQPFVIRAISPVETLGGGRVLSPNARRVRRGVNIESLLADLGSDSPERRLRAAVREANVSGLARNRLEHAASVVDHGQLLDALLDSGVVCEVGGRLYDRAVVEGQEARVCRAVASEHEARPLQSTVEVTRIKRRLDRLPSEFVEAIVSRLVADGRLSRSKLGVALSDWRPRLSADEEGALARAIEAFREGGMRPPTLPTLVESLSTSESQLVPLLDLATERGELTRVAHGVWVSSDAMREVVSRVTGRLEAGEPLRASEIRELLDTSRKFVMPLCEYLDELGVTRRDGDLRHAGPAAGATPK